jgi:hypothetical protein
MRSGSGGVLLLLPCLALGAIWLAQPAVPDDSMERSAAHQREKAERYEVKRARRDAFAAFSQRVCDALASGEMHLADASQRMLTYSESFYPDYLQNLDLAEQGTSTQEKIARNLIRYFANLVHSHPDRANPVLVARLEKELTEIGKS